MPLPFAFKDTTVTTSWYLCSLTTNCNMEFSVCWVISQRSRLHSLRSKNFSLQDSLFFAASFKSGKQTPGANLMGRKITYSLLQKRKYMNTRQGKFKEHQYPTYSHNVTEEKGRKIIKVFVQLVLHENLLFCRRCFMDLVLLSSPDTDPTPCSCLSGHRPQRWQHVRQKSIHCTNSLLLSTGK